MTPRSRKAPVTQKQKVKTAARAPAGGSPRLREKLRQAALGNRIDEVRDLLDRGVDPNQPVKDQTALAWAVYHGHDAVVKLLLARGADPNLGASYPSAGGAMHAVASKGRMKLLPLLLQHGGDPNAAGQRGGRPLHSAIKSDHKAVVRALLEAGARPDLQEDHANKTAWHFAIQKNDPAMLELLADHPSLATWVDPVDQFTLLHEAARCSAEKVIDLLVEHGVPLEARAKDGWTALQLAAANGVLKVVERLLAHGADVGATVEGKTALEHAEAATSPWRSLPVIKLLRAASGVPAGK